MDIKVTEVSIFTKKVTKLIKTHELNSEDYNAFKHVISENPEMGDIIQGTGGLRKTRLKSSSKGKSGGFRVCYYYHDKKNKEIFLITIYPKNEKSDITPEEKKDLKALVNLIKGK